MIRNDWLVRLLALCITAAAIATLLWMGFMAGNHSVTEFGIAFFFIVAATFGAFVVESIFESHKQDK